MSALFPHKSEIQQKQQATYEKTKRKREEKARNSNLLVDEIDSTEEMQNAIRDSLAHAGEHYDKVLMFNEEPTVQLSNATMVHLQCAIVRQNEILIRQNERMIDLLSQLVSKSY